ncbi:hypothetical protein [Candidatus Hakubella thermalkaliphila]|nr:hypothetical protein [Candidatus Hakubella thermalkaliphila]
MNDLETRIRFRASESKTCLLCGKTSRLLFDLKPWNETLHRALTGVSNRQTWENFSHAAGFIKERPDPPLLVASTLLVPGYVDYNLTLFPHSIELYCFLTKIGLYEGWYS